MLQNSREISIEGYLQLRRKLIIITDAFLTGKRMLKPMIVDNLMLVDTISMRQHHLQNNRGETKGDFNNRIMRKRAYKERGIGLKTGKRKESFQVERFFMLSYFCPEEINKCEIGGVETEWILFGTLKRGSFGTV
ncbi:hypothetical protein CEXT_668321 [Caerostris extrusa]|uniref:Uncharacterized protein n=1 Tax=Caerostris extrusa TaxID=172846 RepID=A0AAV4UB96_CAEEX|nr:hypothetical protein CEXT_668321 [Caerostris extrusa]